MVMMVADFTRAVLVANIVIIRLRQRTVNQAEDQRDDPRQAVATVSCGTPETHVSLGDFHIQVSDHNPQYRARSAERQVRRMGSSDECERKHEWNRSYCFHSAERELGIGPTTIFGWTHESFHDDVTGKAGRLKPALRGSRRSSWGLSHREKARDDNYCVKSGVVVSGPVRAKQISPGQRPGFRGRSRRRCRTRASRANLVERGVHQIVRNPGDLGVLGNPGRCPGLNCLTPSGSKNRQPTQSLISAE